ncbi:hypothetical protein L596_021524 [Steinernema carpocapsae]|uniref:Uncharacterized protein n=1 Tax=Steinernema carpocapsae TaxID=34508 RepID=A0A4U5MJ32_STECR|nr:hypothetical protein L596_021524 [Steinernema carpocapsae]
MPLPHRPTGNVAPRIAENELPLCKDSREDGLDSRVDWKDRTPANMGNRQTLSGTRIANGSYHPVFVQVDADRVAISSPNISLTIGNPSLSTTYGNPDIYHKAESLGFTRILPGHSMEFHPNSSGIVYITIYSENESEPLCSNLSAPTGTNYVVNLADQVCKAKTGHIWLDEFENNYYRKPCPIPILPMCSA